MCLCGMLAAEYETMPEPMQVAVVRFFDHNQIWLRDVIADGAKRGEFQLADSAGEAAEAVTGGLEGAMLLARLYGGVDRFKATASQLLAGVTGTQTVTVA